VIAVLSVWLTLVLIGLSNGQLPVIGEDEL
jgi:hypothetical protein